MSRFAFSPYFLRFHPHRERTPEEFLRHRLYGMVLSWIDHVAGYLRHQEDHDLHVVFYESLTSDFDREVARLGERVGVDLSESKLEELKRAVSFSQMKKDSPQHLNSGARTDWRAVLSPTQDRIVADVAGPILDLLGYPVSGSDPVSEPGQFGEDLTAAALDDAIDRCGGTLASKAAYAGSFLTSRRSTREKLAKGLRFIRGAQVRR